MSNHAPYPLDEWGIPKHPAFHKSKFLPARRRFLLWLAQQGGVIERQPGVNTTGNRPGISPTWIIEQAGLTGGPTSVPTILIKLEHDGIITREVVGKSTRRVELSDEWKAKLADQLPGADPPSPPPQDLAGAPTPQQAESTSNGQASFPAAREDAWPEEVDSVDPDLSSFGFSEEQINHVARKLLEQAVTAVISNREAAKGQSALLGHFEGRLAEVLADNGRLRQRLDEARDRAQVLAESLDRRTRERDAARDQVVALTTQIRKLPPPADDSLRRELDRMMREIPRARG